MKPCPFSWILQTWAYQYFPKKFNKSILLSISKTTLLCIFFSKTFRFFEEINKDHFLGSSSTSGENIQLDLSDSFQNLYSDFYYDSKTNLLRVGVSFSLLEINTLFRYHPKMTSIKRGKGKTKNGILGDF